MSPKERHVRAESIRRRQNAGQITPEQAIAYFDLLLDQTGDLHYHGDTTGMRGHWHGFDVMIIPDATSDAESKGPSNLGLITQGDFRGMFILLESDKPHGARPVALKRLGFTESAVMCP